MRGSSTAEGRASQCCRAKGRLDEEGDAGTQSRQPCSHRAAPAGAGVAVGRYGALRGAARCRQRRDRDPERSPTGRIVLPRSEPAGSGGTGTHHAEAARGSRVPNPGRSRPTPTPRTRIPAHRSRHATPRRPDALSHRGRPRSARPAPRGHAPELGTWAVPGGGRGLPKGRGYGRGRGLPAGSPRLGEGGVATQGEGACPVVRGRGLSRPRRRCRRSSARCHTRPWPGGCRRRGQCRGCRR